jgi:tetratricopeptide (TPR) repeat protein
VLQGRLSEALAWNEIAFSLDPLHPTINQNMYLLAAWTGDTDKAARFQQRLLRIDPDNLAHYRLFAAIAVDYGHYAEAVDWAMRVLEELPDDFLALIQLGRAYTFLGRFERAQPVLEKARELAPDNADVIRANALYFLASDRIQQLSEYAAQVLRSFPSRGRPTQNSPAQVARVWAGMADFAKGNYQRAREHLELGLDSSLPDADYPSFAPLLASAYLKLGLRDHAARTLVEANAVSERLREDGLALPELIVARSAISVVEQQPAKAMSLLIEASQAGWLGYWALVNDPRFGPLNDDAGFQQFMLTLREEVDLQSAQVLARN